MKEEPTGKLSRILTLQQRLLDGKVIHKKTAAQQFGVTEKSIQRDLETLRNYFAEQEHRQEVLYDARRGGYYLSNADRDFFTDQEILAACKILLESRSLTKGEMFPLLEKLLINCVPKEHMPTIKELLRNEQEYYIQPRHGKPVLDRLWQLGTAITRQQRVKVSYTRLKDKATVERVLEPVGILFSEYYFYLAAYIPEAEVREKFENPEDRFPTIYRVDRVESMEILPEHFRVPYLERFQEGEFRKRVQFMWGGKLQTITFKYSGPSIEAVLDRLPTAEIIAQQDGVYTVRAEVFGKGIDMWLRSQGEHITAIKYS